MPLTAFSVENYRSFADRTRLDLRPLTLLFGYNSAGKSALLRLLPLVAASVGDKVLGPLSLDTDATRNASFRDLLSRHSASPALALGFEEQDLRVELVLRDLPEHKLQIIERLSVEDKAAGAPLLDASWDAVRLDPAARETPYTYQYGGTGGSTSLAFDGLVPRLTSPAPFRREIDRAAALLRDLADDVHWLNSLRAVPPRAARFLPPPRRLDPTGALADDLIAHDTLRDGRLFAAVSTWYERATRHRLVVRRSVVAGEEQFSLLLSPIGSSPAVEIPVIDTGEGMAQVLPVIVLGALARHGRLGTAPLLAIEHPELHLHPAAHEELAAFFCELASAESPPICLIETHSENFLLRVQIAIARGDLLPERVLVHWVRGLPDGRSVLDTITFDEAARPRGAGWPPGVFAEDTTQARELLRLRKARGLL